MSRFTDKIRPNHHVDFERAANAAFEAHDRGMTGAQTAQHVSQAVGLDAPQQGRGY